MGNVLRKIPIAAALTCARLTGQRLPLFVSWIITNQCNFACAYCNPPRFSSRELSTDEALKAVEAMADSGTKKISLTGGEPFLRNDLGAIVRFCAKKNIMTTINSNGSLVPDKIQDVLAIDVLNLSLDGPESVHDTIRGKGSFRSVIKAVVAARSYGVRVAFFVTLSKFNLDCLEFFLKTAKDYKSLMYFQPGEINSLRSPGLNPHVHEKEFYREFIAKLMIAKKRNRYIGNSISGLKHLSCWPLPHPSMKCSGGFLFCRLDSNGDVKICGRANGTVPAGNILQDGFKKAFSNLRPVSCGLCWCAHRVEFNYVLAGDLPALCNCFKIG